MTRLEDESFNGVSRSNTSVVLGLPRDWRIEGTTIVGTVCGILASLDREIPLQSCPHCGGRQWRFHSQKKRMFRTPPVAGRHTVTVLTYPVFRCASCRASDLVHADIPEGMFTPELLELIADYAVTHPFTDVGREFLIDRQEAPEKIRPIFDRKVKERKDLWPAPEFLGIDVTYKSTLKCCMLVDLQRSRHLEILHYSPEELHIFFEGVKVNWGQKLRCIVIDPEPALRSMIQDAWPGVPLALDHYHVVYSVNKGVTSFIRRYVERHKELSGAYAILWKPEKANYQGKVDELIAGGHDLLVRAVNWAMSLDHVYESPNADEAVERWLDWRDAMSAELDPNLNKTISFFDKHWRKELCEAMNFYVPGREEVIVDPSTGRKYRESAMVPVNNGVTESLHKRVRKLTYESNMLALDWLRGKLLLQGTQQEWDDEYRSARQDLEECKQRLYAAAEASKGSRVLPP